MLSNNDAIIVKLTSSALNAALVTVSSNTIFVSIGNPTPTVTLTNSSGGNICAGVPTTFMATCTYGGNMPVYQWRKNGVPIVGTTNSPSLTTSALQNGDTITVSLTSGISCAIPQTVTSSPIITNVLSAIVPGINANILPGTVLCDGVNVIFVTNITGGGTNPQYQWYKNGVPVAGATTPNYATSALVSSDTVSVLLTSNAMCAAPASVLSNKVGMIIEPIITPTVSATASPGVNIGNGQVVTFKANYTGGGATPAFQWIRNGVDIPFATDTVYVANDLTDGDQLKVQMISSAPCATPSLAISVPLIVRTNTGVIGFTGKEYSAQLFPNPSNGHFTIQLSKALRGSYHVLNVEGKRLVSGQFADKQAIEVSMPDGTPRGLYFVQIQVGDEHLNCKMSLE